MAGKPGRSGGARPGSGRKKKATVEEQGTRRDVLLEVFTPEEWREIATEVRTQVKGGNIGAMLPYLPYLLGSPKQEIEHSQDKPFRIILETVPDRGNDSA